MLVFAASISIVVLLLLVIVLYAVYQRGKFVTMKQMYFERYGGHLLLEKMKSEQGFCFKVFKEKELREATNNFDEKNITGVGGSGIVDKGTINDRLVAIKRCKIIGEREREQFGKEILTLSCINHSNIVKILGCCLEVEIPMLVYEYVPGGTLFDLLHGTHSSPIQLSTRLGIAQNIAEALIYLHLWACPLIVHRDVKVKSFCCQVSDFGSSVPAPEGNLDQNMTDVQGTRGYLDPEYMLTAQLTVKSDVYSFGVVLAELLTSKASYMEGHVARSLAEDFLSAMKEDNVEAIVDDRIAVDGENTGVITKVAELVGACLHKEGERRPEMRKVYEELETLRRAIECATPRGGEIN